MSCYEFSLRNRQNLTPSVPPDWAQTLETCSFFTVIAHQDLLLSFETSVTCSCLPIISALSTSCIYFITEFLTGFPMSRLPSNTGVKLFFHAF